MTGNHIGAHAGLSGIPDKYTKNLKLYDRFLEMADDLWHDCRIPESGECDDAVWKAQYVDITYRGKHQEA